MNDKLTMTLETATIYGRKYFLAQDVAQLLRNQAYMQRDRDATATEVLNDLAESIENA